MSVPSGAAAEAAAGRPIEILPAELDIAIGDHLVIRNDDSVTQFVGPFSVRAGETIDHTFDEPGSYQGQCTLHPSGAITINVG